MRSPLLPIFLIVVVDVLGLTIMFPLLPFYAEHMGATAGVVGLLVSTYAACQLVSGPLLGRLSDRMGRKPLLLVSQVGTLLGFILLAKAWALWVVFASRVIDGATAGNLSLAQAYIADVTTAKDRAKSFALIGIAFGVGFLIGPAISGYLSTFGYTYPVWLAAGLSLTSILATTFLLPRHPKLPEGEPLEEAAPEGPGGKRLGLLDWGSYVAYFQRPALATLLTQFFAFAFAFATFNAGFALFAERRLSFDVRATGYVYAYSGFLGVLLQGGLIGRLVKRFGEFRLVTFGFGAMALGYALLGFTHGVPLLLCAASLGSVGNGLLRPNLTSLITQEVSRREQGVVLGLNQSLMSVCQIVAPALAGFLIQAHALSAWALVAGGMAFLGVVVQRVGQLPSAGRARAES